MTGRQKICFDVERSNVDIFCDYKVTEVREGGENHNKIQRIAKNLHLILLKNITIQFMR